MLHRPSLAAALVAFALLSACQSPGGPFATSAAPLPGADDCAIFAAALGDASFTHGRRLGPPVLDYRARPSHTAPWTIRDSYRRLSGLSERQLRELAEAEAAPGEGSPPRCVWDPDRFDPGEAEPQFPKIKPRTTLRKPARTLDGRFAVVEVNAAWGSLDAIGYECLLARRLEGWRIVRCDRLSVS